MSNHEPPPVPTTSGLAEWYWADIFGRHGPLSIEEVGARLKSGEMPADTLVWHTGATDWKPAHAIEGLTPYLKTNQTPSSRLSSSDSGNPGAGVVAAALTSAATPPSPHPETRSTALFVEPSHATAAKVMTGLGLVLFAPLAIIGWIMGSSELSHIRAGRRPSSGARDAYIAERGGVVGTMTFLASFSAFLWLTTPVAVSVWILALAVNFGSLFILEGIRSGVRAIGYLIIGLELILAGINWVLFFLDPTNAFYYGDYASGLGFSP